MTNSGDRLGLLAPRRHRRATPRLIGILLAIVCASACSAGGEPSSAPGSEPAPTAPAASPASTPSDVRVSPTEGLPSEAAPTEATPSEGQATGDNPFAGLYQSASYGTQFVAPGIAFAVADAAGIEGADSAGAQRVRESSAVLQTYTFHVLLLTQQIRFSDAEAQQQAREPVDATVQNLGRLLVPELDLLEPFDEVWRGHVDAMVAYAAASRTDDEAARAEAVAALEAFATDAGEVVGRANGDAGSAAEVTAALEDYAQRLLPAVDSVATRANLENLRVAALQAATVTGPVLGGGAAARIDRPGATSPGARLLNEASGVVQLHGVLVGIQVQQVLTGSDAGPASDAIAANAAQLGELVGAHLPDQREPVERLLLDHAELAAGYAGALVAGDEDVEVAASVAVEVYAGDAAPVLESLGFQDPFGSGPLTSSDLTSIATNYAEIVLADVDRLAGNFTESG